VHARCRELVGRELLLRAHAIQRMDDERAVALDRPDVIPPPVAAHYFTTNVVDVEPTLPAESATRTATVCVPCDRPCGRSIRRSSVWSSNRPSAVEPSCHGPSSTEYAISAIVDSASVARAETRGYCTVSASITGRVLSIANIVDV